ncbi:MAG TPA: GNAT family N-acetyltransferase [Acidimicrobiales bacterium]|nr:GNAT family N-acetyltransferase [Acidimicrobiales bacterium]
MDAQRRLIRRVTAEDIRPLRHSVLRPGQAFEDTIYPGDEEGVHMGAFDRDRLVGIASLYQEDRVGGRTGGWRLRGMATDPGVRGAGHGGALLARCVEAVAEAGGTELWCNARMAAVGFYRRAGFEVVSDEFDVPGIGGHVVMTRPVPA